MLRTSQFCTKDTLPGVGEKFPDLGAGLQKIVDNFTFSNVLGSRVVKGRGRFFRGKTSSFSNEVRHRMVEKCIYQDPARALGPSMQRSRCYCYTDYSVPFVSSRNPPFPYKHVIALEAGRVILFFPRIAFRDAWCPPVVSKVSYLSRLRNFAFSRGHDGILHISHLTEL